MKCRPLLLVIYLLSISSCLIAQERLVNGDLEGWRRRQFRCCGRNVDTPFDWGIPEQSCGLNYNKFVFLEDNPFNVHSGHYSALLYSDTTFFNSVGLQPGMLVYGGYQDPLDSVIRIGQAVPQYGLPIDSNPEKLDFWLMMSHDLSDTFSYMYIFTRWDSVAHQEDTLAFAQKDVPDTQVPIDQWFEVTDTINYLHAGRPDTVKVIFYGGRFGNPALAANSTWIDDIKFLYKGDSDTTSTGIISGTKDNYRLYPNPANTEMRVQCVSGISEGTVELLDDLGRLVYTSALRSPLQTIDLSTLSCGAYICRIMDVKGDILYQQKVTLAR